MLIPPLSGSSSVKLRPGAPARRRTAPRRRAMIAVSRAPVDMGTPLRFSPLCGSAAQRRNEHTVVPGRAAPSQTLPRVGEWGNPVSPFPCGAGAWGNPVSPHPSPRAYVHVSHHAGLIKGDAGGLEGHTELMGSEPSVVVTLRADLSSRSEKRPGEGHGTRS